MKNQADEKGAFLYTIQHGAGNLFASKSLVAPDGKTERIWRVSEPPTDANVKAVLRRIEAEILAKHEAQEFELAEFFLKVRSGEISSDEFEIIVKKLYENNQPNRSQTEEIQGF